MPTKVGYSGNDTYLAVGLETKIAGERNEDESTGKDYTSTAAEWEATVVDLANDSTTVYTGPCLCGGVWVNGANLTGSAVHLLKDNTTNKLSFSNVNANTNLGFPAFRCQTSLVVDPVNDATGTITVFWRPMDPTNTWTS